MRSSTVVIRAVDPRTDVDAALEIVRACEIAGTGSSDATRESIAALVDGPDTLPEASLLALRDGRPVALLTAEIDRHGRDIFLDAFAIDGPSLQAELIASGIRIARDLAALDGAHPGEPVSDRFLPDPGIWQVVASAYDQDERYRQVLAGLGMRPVRRFWRMLLDLGGRAAAAPVPPVGVTSRPVSGEDDRRLLHRLYRESFAEHFGSAHDRPYEDWIATVEALPGTDPARWWIVSRYGEPVGLCILDDSKAEFNEGYVRTLGVVRPARGLGIATWLLQCAAADSVARGRGGLALTVDGENTTGATELYVSLGFRVRQAIDVWTLPLG